MSTSEPQASALGDPRLLRLYVANAARSIPVEIWALGALIVLAAAIRIVTIDNQSLWMDEALTAYEAHLPFGAMANTVAHVETTPPLYFVLIWAWGHVLGTGEVALRSVSTLAGVALVPIAYSCARELHSRRAGLVAGALVTVNPFLIWYSQEARAYMLLAALTGASFLWFIRARRDPSRPHLIWWAAFSAAALMTHFFAGFLVAPEAVWLLWASRTRIVVIAVVVVAAVQVAMLPFAFIDTAHGVDWIAAISRVNRVSSTLEWAVSILYRRVTIADRLAVLAAGIVVMTLLLGLAGNRCSRQAAKVGALLAGVVIAVPLALGFVGQDYFLARNLMPALIPLITVVAVACVAPRARLLGGALAVGLIVVFSVAAVQVQTKPYLERPNWRKLAGVIGPATAPRAILVANGTTADALKIYLPRVNWVQSRTHPFVISEVDVVGAVKRLPLAAVAHHRGGELRLHRRIRLARGRPVPASVAPPGTWLVSRFRVKEWVLARFVLKHPMRTSVDRLAALAPRFFRRTPDALLIFTQQPGR